MRADVYDAAVHAGVPRGGARGVHQGQTVYVWDGARWYYNAQRAGIPTGQTPVAGALVGFDEYPGNPYGHIAYVESVTSDTDIVISECNGFTLICGKRRVNPRAMKGPLEGYVYGGSIPTPGASQPTTTPTTTTPTATTPTTTTPSTPPPPPTWNETVGGVAHTWTNYTNAGGTQGQSIAAYQTVQISCRVQGFKVADGNTWWYRIHSSPWSDHFYVSADAFYNNGHTSGSLSGTPFVDPAVALC